MLYAHLNHGLPFVCRRVVFSVVKICSGSRGRLPTQRLMTRFFLAVSKEEASLPLMPRPLPTGTLLNVRFAFRPVFGG
jgi:hypothetical protein